MIFTSGIVAASSTSSTLNVAAVVAVITLYLLFGAYFAGFTVAGPPTAAVEKWTAERYDALAELYLLGALSQPECLMYVDRIAEGHNDWAVRTDWRRFRDLRAARRVAGGRHRFRFVGRANLLRFVSGEISGPWDY